MSPSPTLEMSPSPKQGNPRSFPSFHSSLSRGSTYPAAIIGCGNIGSAWSNIFSCWPVTHLAAYQQHPRTKLVALCDTDKAKLSSAAQVSGVQQTFTDVDEMLRVAQPQVVSICTPCENHFEMVQIISRHVCVKGIFLEKPIADSVKKAEEVARLCQEKKIAVIVNHIRRYDRLHRHVKESMPEILGSLQKIIFSYSGDILTHGSHLFDLLRFYAGDISWVQSHKEGNNLNCFVQFSSGLLASVLFIPAKNISVFNLDFLGTKGRLQLFNRPFWDYEYAYFPTISAPSLAEVHLYSGQHHDIFPEKFPRDFFVQAIDNLLLCIEGKSPAAASVEDAARALEALGAALASAETGKKIFFPFQDHWTLSPTMGEFKTWQKN